MMPCAIAVRLQLLAGLRDDLAAMREHQHALPVRPAPDDRGGDDGLAAAGRRDEDDAPPASRDLALEIRDHLVLIGAQWS